MPVVINGTTGIETPGVDADPGTVLAQTLTVNSNNISAVNSLGFRNRIINGDMRIDQRNAGASGTATGYTVDRWVFGSTLSTKGTWQQNAGNVARPAGFSNYLGFTSNSAYTVAAGDYFVFTQPIEGYNVADLGWGAAGAQAVTLSFWVRSSLTGTFGGALKNADSTRSYPFTYTVSAANTWEQKAITIAGDTSGTWGTGNGIGVEVILAFGVGSTYSGPAGAWAGTNYVSATGATSVVGTNGATFYITGVQLEAGSVATPFERRDYGRELILCQRYFEKTYSQPFKPGDTTGYAGGAYQGAIYNNKGSTAGANDVSVTWQYKVVKRAVPTITFYAPNGGNAGQFTAGSVNFNAGINGPIVGDSNSLAYGTATSGGNDCYFHMTAAAEL